ncbi:hypothetical protein BJ912DRAFT_932105 [Pholiota molesta]|nr:hypothetical protein BJ912DRAFT_932105 [Pholiota molesta]
MPVARLLGLALPVDADVAHSAPTFLSEVCIEHLTAQLASAKLEAAEPALLLLARTIVSRLPRATASPPQPTNRVPASDKWDSHRVPPIHRLGGNAEGASVQETMATSKSPQFMRAIRTSSDDLVKLQLAGARAVIDGRVLQWIGFRDAVHGFGAGFQDMLRRDYSTLCLKMSAIPVKKNSFIEKVISGNTLIHIWNGWCPCIDPEYCVRNQRVPSTVALPIDGAVHTEHIVRSPCSVHFVLNREIDGMIRGSTGPGALASCSEYVTAPIPRRDGFGGAGHGFVWRDGRICGVEIVGWDPKATASSA